MINKVRFNIRLLLLFCLFVCNFFVSAKFKMKKGTSELRVSALAKFVAKKKLKRMRGKFIKALTASVSGEDIEFEDGVFEEGENKSLINGALQSSGQIIKLAGGKSLNMQKGKMAKAINVAGLTNRVEGLSTFDNDIVLQDQNSALTVALSGQLLSNIVANGGMITLEQDLSFADGKQITGNATVNLNNQRLSFGASDLNWTGNILFDSAQDIVLNANLALSSTWTFTGVGILNGNWNTLSMNTTGEIVVNPNSSLLIKNIIINDVSDSCIRCLDNSGKITLQDVVWIQDGNYTFTQGSLEFKNKVELIGDGFNFIYESAQTSTVAIFTDLIFDNGFTFSYEPPNSADNLLEFVDQTSQLHLNGATLCTTGSGLALTKGKLVIIKGSTIFSDIKDGINKGITFGSGSLSSEDFLCDIASGEALTCLRGSLNYKNIASTSWNMGDLNSLLRMSAGTSLNLYETLTLGEGYVELNNNSVLARASGKDLIGSIRPLGSYFAVEIL